MTKIAVFVGSLRKNSSNKMLARALAKLAPEDVEFNYININLPLYSEDIENSQFPPEVQKIKDIVGAADGVLLVTPEYNRSVPGTLKNAIDWVSRPFGQTAFNNKPVGIVGSSMSAAGTAVAQADLRHIMLFQNAKVLGQPELYVANAFEVFGEDGTVLSDRWLKNFQEYITAYLAFVEQSK